MFFMLLLNFGFDDDDCCDDSSIENAVYMARRRTVRCGARTRTDRVGRYMLVYDCRRAGVVPARTTLARANDAVLFPAETDDRARQWRDHRLEPPGNVFPFSPVFFFFCPSNLHVVLSPLPPPQPPPPSSFCNPPQTAARTHTRTHTARRTYNIIVYETRTRPRLARVPSIIIIRQNQNT